MESPQSNLTGKVVLVTGAARRIGRGIALRLAAEGARVAIHYGELRAEARAQPRKSAAARPCSAPTWRAWPRSSGSSPRWKSASAAWTAW